MIWTVVEFYFMWLTLHYTELMSNQTIYSWWVHNTWQNSNWFSNFGPCWRRMVQQSEMLSLLPKQCKCLLEMKSFCIARTYIYIFPFSLFKSLDAGSGESVCLCVLALSPKCWTMSQLCSVAVWNKCWNTLWASEQALYIDTTCPEDQ